MTTPGNEPHDQPEPSEQPDRPTKRGPLARWLLTDGTNAPEQARRNAALITGAAGIYVLLVANDLPPQEWTDYVSTAIAIILIIAAVSAWRGYRRLSRSSSQTEDERDSSTGS